MKKRFFALLIILMPFFASSQNLVVFNLNEFAQYKAENGDDFLVVPFDGKSAHEIYNELASNVCSVYNDPSKVMSVVEDTSIKIRAFSDDIIRLHFMGLTQPVGAYYQLEFKIKDGRVRVSAPYVEETLWLKGRENGNFPKAVKGYFKDGKLKEKFAKDYEAVVDKMNAKINFILGITKTAEDDNW